jgi:hypothetical protein
MAYNRQPQTVLAGMALKQNPPPGIIQPAGIVPVTLDADIATTTSLGVVQVGSGLSITPSGVLSAIGGSGPSYSYGTWSPVLVPSPSGTINTTTRNAKYTKIGQQVTCTFDIKITSIIGGSNNNIINLTGLPFTSVTDTGSVGSVLFSYYKDFDKNVNYLGGTVNSNSTTAALWYQQNPGQSLDPLKQDDVKTNTILVGTVTYISNS